MLYVRWKGSKGQACCPGKSFAYSTVEICAFSHIHRSRRLHYTTLYSSWPLIGVLPSWVGGEERGGHDLYCDGSLDKLAGCSSSGIHMSCIQLNVITQISHLLQGQNTRVPMLSICSHLFRLLLFYWTHPTRIELEIPGSMAGEYTPVIWPITSFVYGQKASNRITVFNAATDKIQTQEKANMYDSCILTFTKPFTKALLSGARLLNKKTKHCLQWLFKKNFYSLKYILQY
jgi:hypothetical protein